MSQTSAITSGFFNKNYFGKNATDKQKVEKRIKNSLLNFVLDKNITLNNLDNKSLNNKYNGTSIIVNNRDEEGIDEFIVNERRYISFPANIERKFERLGRWEAEDLMDDILSISLAKSKTNIKLISNEEMMSESINFLEENNHKLNNKSIDNFYNLRVSTKNSKDIRETVAEGITAEDGKIEDRSVESYIAEVGMKKDNNVEDTEDENEINCKRIYKFEETNFNPKEPVSKEERESGRYYSSYKSISEDRMKELNVLADRISKSFNGRFGKNKTIVPNKRIHSRSLSTDDTKYVTKKYIDGKFMKINFIIDMSGSMCGEPVKQAVEMAYIFNELAISNNISGSIMYSDTNNRELVILPAKRDLINHMNKTGSSEGLYDTMLAFKEEMSKADVNICMTDGMICDSPIENTFYTRNKIECIGVYVNKEAEDLSEYTGSLNRWFTKSLVRRTTEELCEKIIQLGLRSKRV